MNRKAASSLALLVALAALVVAEAAFGRGDDANIGLGFLGVVVFVASVTLATIALSEIKRTGERGRAVAWLSILLVGGYFLALLVLEFL